MSLSVNPTHHLSLPHNRYSQTLYNLKYFQLNLPQKVLLCNLFIHFYALFFMFYFNSSLAIVKIPIVFGLAFLNTLLHSFTVLPVVNISSTNKIFLLYKLSSLKSSYTPCIFFALSSLFNLLCSIMSFTLKRQSSCSFKLKLVFLDISFI